MDVTIKDIARMAGVSVATVSRVINRTGLVTQDKCLAVEKVLSEVNYIPNSAARSLVNRRSKTVGLIVPILTNPIFAPTIGAVEATLAKHGFGLLVSCNHRDPEIELAQTRMMVERGVEGIIFTGSCRHPMLMPMLQARNIAAVSQDDPLGAPGLVSLGMPDAEAMSCAIDELVARGHRSIGVLSGPTENTRPIADRLAGGLARLSEHGIRLDAHGVAETADYSMETARSATRQLLKDNPSITAVACTSDGLAIGVIAECASQGLRVPDDISVTGCGGTVMGQYVYPSLATVRLPFEDLGHVAADQLLGIINEQPMPPTHQFQYNFELGDSVRDVCMG